MLKAFIIQFSFRALFKKTIVTPASKKDDPEKIGKNRTKSITGAFAEVFEKLLHNQITDYVNKKRKLQNSFQVGFR